MLSDYQYKGLCDDHKFNTTMLMSEDRKIADSLLAAGKGMSEKQFKYLIGLHIKGCPDSFLADGEHPEYGYDPYSVQEIV